jgi:hypothetical protein
VATRPYWLSFGASAVSGLAPTFIQFRSTAGSTLAPPSITEPGSFGMYLFNYDPITQVAFICDGATSGLAFNDRYVQGVLDPFDQFGVTMVAQGNSLFALGTSNIALGTSIYALGVSIYAFGTTSSALLGTTASSYGTDSVDPQSIFGFLKRAQETREGNEDYTKSSGVLTISSRGSSQLFATKTISDSTTSTTKT